MAEFANLKFRQVDKALKEGRPIPIEKLGQRIKDIRAVLGMTQAQMANRLKIKQPTLSKIEENIESSSLKTVLAVCRALNCEFLGSIMAKKSLKKLIDERAEKLARKTLERTTSNMAMEKQAPDKSAYNYQFKKLINDFVRNPRKELWEDY